MGTEQFVHRSAHAIHTHTSRWWKNRQMLIQIKSKASTPDWNIHPSTFPSFIPLVGPRCRTRHLLTSSSDAAEVSARLRGPFARPRPDEPVSVEWHCRTLWQRCQESARAHVRVLLENRARACERERERGDGKRRAEKRQRSPPRSRPRPRALRSVTNAVRGLSYSGAFVAVSHSVRSYVHVRVAHWLVRAVGTSTWRPSLALSLQRHFSTFISPPSV